MLGPDERIGRLMGSQAGTARLGFSSVLYSVSFSFIQIHELLVTVMLKRLHQEAP